MRDLHRCRRGVFLEDDRDTLSPAERAAIAEAEEWSRHNAPIPHEQVLAELGLTMDEWERMSRGGRPNGQVHCLDGAGEG